MKTEEIIKAAQAYYPSGILHEEAKVSAFVRGAKWALGRAREWLDDIDFDMEYWNHEDGFCKVEFIAAFRQAMEGGAE